MGIAVCQLVPFDQQRPNRHDNHAESQLGLDLIIANFPKFRMADGHHIEYGSYVLSYC